MGVFEDFGSDQRRSRLWSYGGVVSICVCVFSCRVISSLCSGRRSLSRFLRRFSGFCGAFLSFFINFELGCLSSLSRFFVIGIVMVFDFRAGRVLGITCLEEVYFGCCQFWKWVFWRSMRSRGWGFLFSGFFYRWEDLGFRDVFNRSREYVQVRSRFIFFFAFF